MTPRPRPSRALTPWLLAGPGALFFAGMLLVPLALTVMLSFQRLRSCDRASRTPSRSRTTSRCVTDEYYSGSSGAPCWIAALTTLICVVVGAPEAYILARMRNPWRSVFLLVIIGAAAGLGGGPRLRLEHAARLAGPREPGIAARRHCRRCKHPLHRDRRSSSRSCT